MAFKKFSELPAVTYASGAAVVPMVQDGATVKVTVDNLAQSLGTVNSATSASYIEVQAANDIGATYWINFSNGTGIARNIYADLTSGMTYRPSTNTLTVSNISGSITNAVTASYSDIFRIAPVDPLPASPASASFAVSASVPPVPYFWDGTEWHALY